MSFLWIVFGIDVLVSVYYCLLWTANTLVSFIYNEVYYLLTLLLVIYTLTRPPHEITLTLLLFIEPDLHIFENVFKTKRLLSWLLVSQTYVTYCQSNICDFLSVKHTWLLVSQTYVTSCQSNIRDFLSGYRHIHFDFISMSVSRDLSVKRCQVQVVCYSIQ